MKVDFKRIPLIAIGGIFIFLIIIVNVSVSDIGKSSVQKLCEGIDKLVNDDYNIIGEISIQNKEDDTIIDAISFLYEGVIRNSDNRIKLSIDVKEDNLRIEKELGKIYKFNYKIVIDPLVEKNSYYYNLPNEEIDSKLDMSKVEQTLDYVHNSITNEGKRPITINSLSKKIMTNKLSINITSTDIYEIITHEEKYKDTNKKLLDTFKNDEYTININTYLDNKNYVKKIELIIENNDFKISSINYIEDYNKVDKISIEDVLDNGVNIEDIDEGDILRIISKMFDI
ncbi:hypothetical protein [Vallitalea guaymasensis]|uniref:Uncharacterized protein n=1 Tax=Vallitalea guaymasensis TaxID=1185412 RepID=A0A8J8SCJ6_9FIRM|nr:hypothetical protein [Vallitalea guaymasensis]QUH29500.1 hypothetical protein HYG85_11525 [Vallitalea guaymasensis]